MGVTSFEELRSAAGDRGAGAGYRPLSHSTAVNDGTNGARGSRGVRDTRAAMGVQRCAGCFKNDARGRACPIVSSVTVFAMDWIGAAGIGARKTPISFPNRDLMTSVVVPLSGNAAHRKSR